MAISRRMADKEDWLPGADIQAACKELRDVKAWLAAVLQKKQARITARENTDGARANGCSEVAQG